MYETKQDLTICDCCEKIIPDAEYTIDHDNGEVVCKLCKQIEELTES